MSSTYSPDLRIELIGTGDQAGVWGSTTNNNLGTFIENAVAGYTSVSIVASPQALTANDGAADEARFAAIALTTTTGTNFTVCIPPNSKLYTFYNASSYVATVTNSTVKNGIIASGGTTIAIPAGKTMTVWSDGTNVAQQNTHLISPTIASATLTTPALGTPASGTLTSCTGLPISTGVSGLGSGIATALAVNVGSAGAPVLNGGALGTPSSGTLTNATGLPIDGGTTGTLPVSRGGTGATSFTSGALLKGAGTSAVSVASASDIVGQIGSTAVQNATAAANGGVTSVNAKTGAVQSVLTSGSNTATTSGTSVEFATGIPSWVKRITIMMSGVSSNGTDKFILQLGTSGGYVTSGYVSQSVYLYANPVITNITNGIGMTGANAAAESVTGQMIICNQTSNTWTGSGQFARSGGAYVQMGMGGVDIGAALTKLRITTINGTDTFDTGSINILYE